MITGYERVRQRYDGILRDIVPSLTAGTIDQAVGAVNALVRLQRLGDWTGSDSPQRILGITSDREIVVYGGGGPLSFYHAEPLGSVEQRVSKMLASALQERDAPLPEELPPEVVQRLREERLTLAQNLRACLTNLVTLP